VDETYRLPLRKIVISTWLADVMAERFASPAAVVVTPVDPALFHPVPEARDGRLSTLMLHHEYLWKGVAEGIEVARRVKAQNPGLRLIGFGVKPPAGASPYDEFFADPPQVRLAWLYSRCPIYLCRPGTRGSACRPWRRWPAAPHSARTTMAAAGTTRSTAARRWWRRAATWTPSRGPGAAGRGWSAP
jgi:hypothetical protein